MSTVEQVDAEGRTAREGVMQPSYPFDVWTDPIDAATASPSRAHIAVKRLVFVVAALNVVVLAGILVFKLSAGGNGATASVPGAQADRVVDGDPAPVDTDPGADLVAADPSVGDDGAVDEPTPDVSVVATYPPPYPDPFEPVAAEVQVDAKVLGTAAAYVITNYEVDATLNDVLATLPPVAPEFADGMVLEVQTVHHPGMWSRGTVEYAQLGGHLDGRISIIVVIRQEIGVEGSGEPQRVEKRVMEVRLFRSEFGAWELETIASAGGHPIERPDDLTPLEAAVVDNPRIDLPDTAAWDIYAGGMDPALMQLMLDIAGRTPYAVVVLRTGHSYNVFGTPRVSNHSVGRAVDIYMLDPDSPFVVESHDTSSKFYAVSEWIVSRSDIKEFGSPWRFPDAVAHTFTNQVHHDHLHIGVFAHNTPPATDDQATDE